jgi:hypothetical protein
MKNLWVYLLIVFCVVLPLLFAEFYGCSVSGREFSPDDFSVRRFAYRRSPLSGTLRSKRENSILDYCGSIAADGHITIVNSKPQKWDLCSEDMQYSNRLSHEFDARFLTHYLNYNSDQWTTAYPELAGLLWPEVATMAREGLYLYLPEILLVAIPEEYHEGDDRSIEEFKSDIQTKFADAYRLAAKVAKANSDPDAKVDQWLKAAEKFDNGDFGSVPTRVTAESVPEDLKQSAD